MQLGMIGLGKMGGNMARRLRRAGIDVVGFNRDTAATDELASEVGLVAADSARDLVARLAAPRRVWLMLPAGAVTEGYVTQMTALLDEGDVLVDGANSYYKDSLRRAALCADSGIGYVEDATSVERPAHAGGTPGEEQFCRTCVLYSGGEAQGACGAVGGQIVKGGGWCKIWAPKG